VTLRYQTERRAGYLHATIDGEFELAAALAAFRGIFHVAAGFGQPRILVDCTGVRGAMTPSDRLQLGTFMADEQRVIAAQLPNGPRIAILAVPPIMDPGRFTQTVANNRGVRMRASESLQELLSWLGV